MDGQERLRVLLELDRGAGDALTGRIGLEGRVREFSGWLSLIAALESARQVEGEARSPPPNDPSDVAPDGVVRDTTSAEPTGELRRQRFNRSERQEQHHESDQVP